MNNDIPWYAKGFWFLAGAVTMAMIVFGTSISMVVMAPDAFR